ncbi:maleylpyruvate isomerase N-terminal domain-containing protein, partial [Actinoallomurus acaciae]
MAVAMEELIRDLSAETADLDRLLGPDVWDVPTPAERWAVRDQIAHLAWFDDAAVRAVTTPEAFRAEARAALDTGLDADALAAERRSMPGEDLLAWFRAARAGLTETLAAADPKTR